MESEIELIPLQRALKRMLDFRAQKEKEALPRCQEYFEHQKSSGTSQDLPSVLIDILAILGSTIELTTTSWSTAKSLLKSYDIFPDPPAADWLSGFGLN